MTAPARKTLAALALILAVPTPLLAFSWYYVSTHYIRVPATVVAVQKGGKGYSPEVEFRWKGDRRWAVVSGRQRPENEVPAVGATSEVLVHPSDPRTVRTQEGLWAEVMPFPLLLAVPALLAAVSHLLTRGRSRQHHSADGADAPPPHLTC